MLKSKRRVSRNLYKTAHAEGRHQPNQQISTPWTNDVQRFAKANIKKGKHRTRRIVAMRGDATQVFELIERPLDDVVALLGFTNARTPQAQF
jgi:hypothetical protein